MAAACLDPTMTIATKDAFAALNTMFKVGWGGRVGGWVGGLEGGWRGVACQVLYWPTTSLPACPAPPACLAVQGSLPLEHGSLPPNPHSGEPTLSFGRGGGGGAGGGFGGGGSSAGLHDPTMTISTKAAFEAINSMFKVGGGGWVEASG